MLEQLKRLWMPLTIAGAVALILTRMGAPRTTDEAAVFIAVGAFGLLALLVQRMDARQDAHLAQQMEHQRQEAEAWTRAIDISRGIVEGQSKMSEVLVEGMGQVGNHMATMNAELRTLSERNLAALELIQGRLLEAGLRKPAKARKRGRTA